MGRLLILAVVAVACGAPRVAPPPAPVPAKPAPFRIAREDPTPPLDLRLPDGVKPVSYRAEISLDPARLVGTLEVDVEIAAPTDTIWMHGAGLVIDLAEARAGDGVTTRLDARLISGGNGDVRFLALLARTALPAGRYTLRVRYATTIPDLGDVGARLADHYARDEGADGVFRERVESRGYTFTMFEPFGAREVFPCFDEPRFKVPWQLVLEVPAGEIALSNSPVVAETPLPTGRRRFAFAPTPPLPSYLIAFATGPFDLVEVPGAGVPMRVAVRAGHAPHAAWAVQSSRRVLDLVLAWTALPFPYAKLDVVAVPVTGVGWTAMENPGLITVLESTLRADGTAGQTREDWVSTLAHELVHYWFGDSVTPAWWDDIWLNESFAYWLAPQLRDGFRDRWRAELAMPVSPPPPPPPKGWYGAVPWVGAGARPSERLTTSAAKLRGYMSGQRGVPVIEMIEGLTGRERFRDVLRAYLAAHANGLATTAELIPMFTAAAGMPLEDAVDVYLDDATAPDLRIAASCAARPPTITVTRTTAAGQPIPMCMAYEQRGARVDTCFLFATAQHDVAVATCPKWIVPNTRAGIYTPQVANLDSMLALAWPKLVVAERVRLVRQMEPSAQRFASALRLLDERDDAGLEAAFPVIMDNLRYVPDAMRAKFDARLRAKVETRAGPLAHADPSAAALARLLAAVAREPTALREATAQLDTQWWSARDAAIAAFGAEPALVAAQLAREPAGGLMLRPMAHSPQILDVIEQHLPAFNALTPASRLVLLATRCEPQTRAQALRIATASPDLGATLVAADLDRCKRERDQVEPVVRAWIDSKP